MLVGGSFMNAFDARNPDAFASGTGWVMQLAQRGAGLSGGSWAIGSWALANYPSFVGAVFATFVWSEVADVWYAAMRDEVWDLEDPLVGPQLFNMGKYSDAVDSTKAKATRSCPSRSSMPTVV